MGTNRHDIAAVIMAGGSNSRFGALGRVLPKSLLPVSEEHTLLTRLIAQLLSSDIRQIVVCCSPENHCLIGPFLERYREMTGLAKDGLRVAACAASQFGPLPALEEVLCDLSAAWNLLCLGDIYFAEAPFESFLRQRSKHDSQDGVLLTGTDLLAGEGEGSGAVACDGSSVCAISYKPFPARMPDGRQERRWSGSFFFRRALASNLHRNKARFHHAPYEQWIQGLLEEEAFCGWLDAGPFVNVNRIEDYRYLINSDGTGSVEGRQA